MSTPDTQQPEPLEVSDPTIELVTRVRDVVIDAIESHHGKAPEILHDTSEIGVWESVGQVLERAKLAELTAGADKLLRCAFCGQPYPEGTPDHKHERLAAHVRVCEAHPIGRELRELKAAARVLLDQGVGDYVYSVRERECQGWDGPKVKAWGAACETLARLCPREVRTDPVFTFEEATRTLWVDVLPEHFWTLMEWRNPSHKFSDAERSVAVLIAEKVTEMQHMHGTIDVKVRALHMGAAAIERAMPEGRL